MTAPAPVDWATALAFSLRPVTYAHPSWWLDAWLPAALFERLRLRPFAQPHLSRFLLSAYQLDGHSQAAMEFADRRQQLALLAPDALLDLVHRVGLTLHSPIISRVVLRRDRDRINAALGDADYAFARNTGARLFRASRIGADRALAFRLDDLDSWRDRCDGAGLASLAELTADLDEGWRRRMLFKLPKPLVDAHWPAGTDAGAAVDGGQARSDSALARLWFGLTKEMRLPWPR